MGRRRTDLRKTQIKIQLHSTGWQVLIRKKHLEHRVGHFFGDSIFLLLAGNYVLVWLLSWVARSLLNGPWRVRPWQTLVLMLNFVSLPIVYYRVHGEMVWGFLGINVLLFAGLFASTAILVYFGDRLPMNQIFAADRGMELPVREPMPQADSHGS